MITQIIIGSILIGFGAVFVYFARFLMTKFMPKYANEKGIMLTKVIGFALVAAGAFVIFFFGIGELQVRGY